MTNAGDSAFPLYVPNCSEGLTKREYIATHLLAGLLANSSYNSYEIQVDRAVKATDVLIKELNETI